MVKPVTFVLLALAASSSARGQESPPPAGAAPNDARGGVEFALKRYIVVFNSHDADKLAELWTPEAVYVDTATGERTEGRGALAADFRALFAASPEIVLSGQIEGIRLPNDGVALVDGVTTTVSPDEEPETSSYAAVFVKREGKWLVDSVHESPLPSPETPRQALEPLAWLVGQWQDAGDAQRVDTAVRWSLGDAFLIRTYTIAPADGENYTGTQVIGWDPRGKQIRSWTFNSDGSFGEGTWLRDGDEWVVRTAQTLGDGSAATGTQVIRQVDENTATVQTIAKEVDGSPEPASPPVTMVRVAEPPDAAGAAAAGEEASR